MYIAIFINLVVIGAWHGANWTYVLFGAYHGIILVIIAATERKRRKFEKKYSLKKKAYYKYTRILITFFLVSFGLIIFRASNLSESFEIMQRLTYGYGLPFVNKTAFVFGIPFILLLIFKEFKDENKYNIHFLHSKRLSIRIASIVILLICVFLCGNLDGGQFIYFQF
jgi:D-alanyl-lipoteichoic acid acyltransferase DltB (MBOAT superfamily)